MPPPAVARSRGGPAYLCTDDPTSPPSSLADRLEEEQLDAGDVVLALAADLLRAEDQLSPYECEFALRRLAECLRDALRIARSRGARLPHPEVQNHEA